MESLLNIPVAVLAAVFTLIAVRKVGKYRLPIWAVMTAGALAVLLTGRISPAEALQAIDFDVMIFLFGVFVAGQALEESGYLSQLSRRIFRSARSPDHLLVLVLFFMALLSAFLMNDTLAVIGAPVMLMLAQKHRMPPRILPLALAFAVTTGSVMSPIGNPQNLLIAIHGGLENPFLSFLGRLFVPTMLSLGAVYAVLKIIYGKQFSRRALAPVEYETASDPALLKLARLSLAILVAMTALKILLSLLGRSGFPLTLIAAAAALPVLLFSPKRWHIARRIDWHTLIFFAAMFVLMRSVWNTGALQHLIRLMPGQETPSGVLLISVLLSQLISNVPMVALYLPMLTRAAHPETLSLALAAGSTIAGNLFILGAASNVIIIQRMEKKSGETLTFREFAAAGIPITLAQILIYWFFLSW